LATAALTRSSLPITGVPPVNKALIFVQIGDDPLHVPDLWRGGLPLVPHAASEEAENIPELLTGWIEVAFGHCFAQAADALGLAGQGAFIAVEPEGVFAGERFII
jgi:hypothetical protein